MTASDVLVESLIDLSVDAARPYSADKSTNMLSKNEDAHRLREQTLLERFSRSG